ncbi:MAG: hypothetical protein ACOC0X_04030 [Halobacteriota archaeon]
MSSEPTPAFRPAVLLRPLGLWVVLAVVAVVNGAVRELLIIPTLGEYPGHLLSTALLLGAILLVAGVYFRRSTVAFTQLELAVIGIVWTTLTVGFEFLVGYVEGTSVDETLSQYDVLGGRVWILVPLTLLLAPTAFGWYLRVER